MNIFTRYPLATCTLAAVSVAALGALGVAGAASQPDEKSNDKAKDDAARRRLVARQANRLLYDCRQKMEGKSAPRVETYRAKILQEVDLQGQTFTARGQYVQGRGLLRRLELDLKFGRKGKPTTGKLLQVCDGDILTTQQIVNDRPRVTRRKVREILNVAKQMTPAEEPDRIAALGLGGIAGLIASLQSTMTFDRIETKEVQSTPVRMLEGAWNERYLQQFARMRTRDGRLPAHVPDRVRVIIDARSDARYKDLIRRIEYLKKEGEGDGYRPLMTITLRDIELNPPDLTPKADDKTAQDKLIEKYFTITLAKNAFERDTTKEYIDQLKAVGQPRQKRQPAR